MKRQTLLALLLAVQCLLLSAQSNEFKVEKLADGVYAVIRTHLLEEMANSNVVLVINEEDVVVIDANLTAGTARSVLAQIRKLTDKPVRYVINTHWHNDHIIGNQTYRDSFPGVEIIAHPTAREAMHGRVAPSLERGRTRYPEILADLKTQLAADTTDDGRPMTPERAAVLRQDIAAFEWLISQLPESKVFLPTLTVDGSLTLYRGSREIQLYYLGRGNTDGDLIVYLPKEKILMGGDLLVRPIPFSLGSFIGDWITTLQRLKTFEADAIVPGHGEVMRDFRYVDKVISMLEYIHREVKSAVAAGLDLEATQRKVDLSAFRQELAGDNLVLQDWFDQYFGGPAVSRAFLELSGELEEAGK